MIVMKSCDVRLEVLQEGGVEALASSCAEFSGGCSRSTVWWWF